MFVALDFAPKLSVTPEAAPIRWTAEKTGPPQAAGTKQQSCLL